MAASITWSEGGAPQAIEAGEVLIAQLFAVLAVAATRRARTKPQRAVAAWLAWHDVCVYGRDVERIALDEIPWDGDPEEKRAFLIGVVDSLEGRAWVGLFPVRPKVEKLEELIRRLRSALDVHDPAPSVENQDEVAPPARLYGRCLLHVVPLHRYGCIVCNHDELYGALSTPQCVLAGKLLSATDPTERSEAARLLAAEATQEPSRITLCALAHVHSLAVEREPPGLLRTSRRSPACSRCSTAGTPPRPTASSMRWSGRNRRPRSATPSGVRGGPRPPRRAGAHHRAPRPPLLRARLAGDRGLRVRRALP